MSTRAITFGQNETNYATETVFTALESLFTLGSSSQRLRPETKYRLSKLASEIVSLQWMVYPLTEGIKLKSVKHVLPSNKYAMELDLIADEEVTSKQNDLLSQAREIIRRCGVQGPSFDHFDRIEAIQDDAERKGLSFDDEDAVDGPSFTYDCNVGCFVTTPNPEKVRALVQLTYDWEKVGRDYPVDAGMHTYLLHLFANRKELEEVKAGTRNNTVWHRHGYFEPRPGSGYVSDYVYLKDWLKEQGQEVRFN